MLLSNQSLAKFWQLAVLGACMVGGISHVYGETTGQTSATAPVENKIKAVGMLDIRPSWFTQSGAFDTENTVEFGAKLTADTTVTYFQPFNTNVYNPLNQEASSGVNLQMFSSAIRTKVNNIWKDDSNGLALAYESRVYLPIDRASRDAGLITAARNYLKLSKTVSDRLKFTLSEAVIPIINTRSGNISASGAPVANNIFENRVYFITDLQLTEKLSLSIPVMFHQTRTANFRSDAANNARWSYLLWINPELDYAVNDNLTLGLSYYNNDSLMTPDLSKTNFGKAFESGELQFVLTATL